MFDTVASLPPPQVASEPGSRPRAPHPAAGKNTGADTGERSRAPSSAAQAAAAPAGQRLRGKRVLLAEGNAAVREAVRKMLAACGGTLDIVDDGEQALRCLRESRFDLVLLACQMPRADGFEVVRRLRGSASGHFSTRPDTPVIALTAAPLGDVDRCRNSGFSDCLAKLVRGERLLQTLQRWADDTDAPDAPARAEIGAAADASSREAETILDLSVICRIREMQRRGAAGLLPRLCALFLDTSAKLVDSIDEALADDDAEALRLAAHALKSASGNLGAVRLSLRCAELEALGREGRSGAAGAVWRDARVDWERAVAALRQIASEAVSA